MTFIQLQYLIAVANHGNFSVAAEHCFITQPSLSMQIKNLEDELGVILLDRSRKPVVPTEAGEAVIEQAKVALAEVDAIREIVQSMKGEMSGELRLAAIPTIAPYLLHKFIPGFAAAYPRVDVRIREMVTQDVIRALEHDEIDVAIVAGGTCGGVFHEEDLFNDRFWAYVSPRHPLYNRSNIRIEDIDPKDLVLLSRGNCMRDQVVELCQASSRVDSRFSFESGSLDSLMRIVDSTATMTIIPEMALEYIPEEHRDQVKQLVKGTSYRKISMVYRRTYAKRSMVEALKESVMEAVKQDTVTKKGSNSTLY